MRTVALLADGARDLDQLPLPDAEIGDAGGRVEIDLRLVEDGAGASVDRVPVEEPEALRRVAEEQVLGDGHLGDQGQLLIDHRDAGGVGVARRGEPGRLAAHQQLALVAAVRMEAAEQLDQRALAGAVLAAQRVHFAGPQREVDLAEGGHAAERLGEAAGLEQRGRAHGWAGTRGGRLASGVPR
jgi:hypothetical protein